VQELRTFYSVLRRVIGEVDIVFCHMIPRFAVLAAPLVRLRHKPLIFWYAHRQSNLELRLALMLCSYIVTSTASAFPVPTKKVRVLGQGIDFDFFSPDPQCPLDNPPVITCVARLMPIKYHETLLRAVAEIPHVQLAVVGNVPAGQDTSYLSSLQNLTRTLGIADRVLFTGGLPPEGVRDIHRRAMVAVNLSPPGLFDKAALESMLCGVPTIVANPAFDPVLGDYAPLLRIANSDDTAGLAERLRALLAPDFLDSAARQTMVQAIRERVQAAHSLDGLMDRLVALMESAR
jgi:glycosyltransferase involved in cell wall biosynthesis